MASASKLRNTKATTPPPKKKSAPQVQTSTRDVLAVTKYSSSHFLTGWNHLDCWILENTVGVGQAAAVTIQTRAYKGEKNCTESNERRKMQALLSWRTFSFQGENRLLSSASLVSLAVSVFSCGNRPLGGTSWIEGLRPLRSLSGAASKQALDHLFLLFTLILSFYSFIHTLTTALLWLAYSSAYFSSFAFFPPLLLHPFICRPLCHFPFNTQRQRRNYQDMRQKTRGDPYV